ncbi:MAG: preprotein translocase subunit SecE [Acidimicrobiia bacterium]
MNREMRRLMEREERIQKGEDGQRRRPAAGGGTKGPGAPERKPLLIRLTTFLHEVRQELRKVNWPNREQMVVFVTVVLIVTVVLTLVIFALDVTMKEAVFQLLERAE